MRKTQASILDHGFLGKRLEELKHVSVAVWLRVSHAKFVLYIFEHVKTGGPFFRTCVEGFTSPKHLGLA